MSERIGQFSQSWHGLNVFICLPVGTGRVLSVSQLVNILLYVTKILYSVLY